MFIVIEMFLMVKFIKKGPHDHAEPGPAPTLRPALAGGRASAVALMRKED